MGFEARSPMWDVLYAIDASTSMGEPSRLATGATFVKIEAVKDGIVQTARSAPFPFGSRIGVIGFKAATKALGTMVDAGQEMVQEVLPLTQVAEFTVSPARLLEMLDSLKVGGATPTGEGLRTAVDLLYAKPDERKRIKKVVLVTDEKSNAGPRPETIVDPRLAGRAIVDVVAVGRAPDAKTLESLKHVASRTGGSFTVAEAPLEIAKALDPRIPYSSSERSPLLEEASRISSVLKSTDRSSVSYPGLADAARAVRARLEQKLQEVITLEGQARGDADLVMSAAANDPKWPTMSMREYADRVWSRVSDLTKLQAMEADYRREISALAA